MSASERLLLGAVFAIWCAVAITGAVVHEPWWDEAQPWLIARDASLTELFTHVVRHEGHPPLWFLILAIPAKLGLPYWTMKIVGLLCGAATVLLLLFGFPRVPLYIRVLAPFALFIAYQYTVVARSYVLFGPLLLGIARIWDRRHERFGTFVTLIILLSHVSVHGFAMACGLAVGGWRLAGRRWKLAIVFVVNAILLVAMLWPPSDLASQAELHDIFSPRRYFFVLSSLIPALFWNPAGNESMTAAIVMACIAVIALLVLIAWFAKNRVAAPFLLGTAGTLLVMARYYRQWHEGIVFFLLLFAIVIAFERRLAPRWLDVAAQIVIVLLLVRHAQWTFQSLAYDIQHDFTGSAKASKFLAPIKDRVVYGTGISTVELQPYFRTNLFANADSTYWDWSKRARPRRIPAGPPDVIVCAISSGNDHVYAQRLLRDPRYRAVSAFEGYPFWKTRRMRGIAFVIFQRSGT